MATRTGQYTCCSNQCQCVEYSHISQKQHIDMRRGISRSSGDFGRGRWSIDAHYITLDGMWRVPLVTFLHVVSNLWTSSVERDPLIGRSCFEGLSERKAGTCPNHFQTKVVDGVR
ncbi:hypothetical protein SCLCIDRAFT_678558 [Scleroderma citrinum Foug A]|uniref:Uncharacterized protein n=1 Tax=Scleroderma citrinum Foug A TaxID=1036808 RepID=A0A0C3AGE8_9AGAM|nr:hypothetical protein SCLCIDRAFT_678558 [Scleroderma citrinum Foug A]